MDLAEHLVTSETPEECLDVRIERLPGQAFSDYRLGRGRGAREFTKGHGCHWLD